MEFAQRLKQAMECKSITMYRLAKELGVHQTTIKNWLDGKGGPNLGQVKQIAKILNADIVYLISGQTSAEVERGILIQAAAEARVDRSIRIHLSPEQQEYSELMKKYTDGTITDAELRRLVELQTQRPPLKESFGMLKTTLDRMKRCLDPLNEEGQQKVIKHAEAYAQDLAEIPRYRAETAPQSLPAPQEGKDTTTPPGVPETPPEGEQGGGETPNPIAQK